MPCIKSWAMMALLSSALETWQSVQYLFSNRPAPRTVCGTLVLKAMPLNPSAETVCCWT